MMQRMVDRSTVAVHCEATGAMLRAREKSATGVSSETAAVPAARRRGTPVQVRQTALANGAAGTAAARSAAR